MTFSGICQDSSSAFFAALKIHLIGPDNYCTLNCGNTKVEKDHKIVQNRQPWEF